MLPELCIGDKVLYKHEHEGVIIDIQRPLGYNEFTIKLLNGFTRICARFQISKIDNFFHETGPSDEDWQAIQAALESSPEQSLPKPTKSAARRAKSVTGNQRTTVKIPRSLSAERPACTRTDSRPTSVIPQPVSAAFPAPRPISVPQPVCSTPRPTSATVPTVSLAGGLISGVPASVTDTSNAAPFVNICAADVNRFITDHENPQTASKTAGHLKLLKNYLVTKSENREIHEIPPRELNEYLACFFLAVRTQKGQEYEPSSLRDMMSSFIRHLNRMEYGVSLLESVEFSGMREALKSKQKNLKSQGKGNRSRAAEPLTEAEINQLYQQGELGLATPQSLMNTLWFNNCVYFGLRGGQAEHRAMCWGDVCLKSDSNGNEFLELVERATKTRTGENIRDVRKKQPRAWANTDDPSRCPVEAYKLYAAKRPPQYCNENDPFYIATVTNNPRPTHSERWFISQPVGKNKLCALMSTMCDRAGLSGDRRLTNHSTRKYLIQRLDDANIPPTHIMQITGHRNVNSITNYSTISDAHQKQISHIISGSRKTDTAITASTSAFNNNRPQPENQVLQVANTKHPDVGSQPGPSHSIIPVESTQTLQLAHSKQTSSQKIFNNCHIGTIVINNYGVTTGSPPRKRQRPCVIYSDSDNSQNQDEE